MTQLDDNSPAMQVKSGRNSGGPDLSSGFIPDLFQTYHSDDFPRVLREFDAFGTPTQVETVGGTPYFINEFWTARQRQASRIQEVSYRACFKPQLPAFFIQRLTRPGDVVYDPFMGRGTTPVEAALHGRVPYGCDANPLSRALVTPRINPPSLGDIGNRLAEIPWDSFGSCEHERLLAFYHPRTLAQIEGLRGWMMRRSREGRMDQTNRWIRMVALNRLTGHSSGFLSVYTMPPNQAVSVESQIKINKRRGQTPPFRDAKTVIFNKSKKLLSDGLPRAGESLFLTAQSHETGEIPDNSVTLTVTSPPFLDVVNYERDNWLRCWFIGVDPKEVRISIHRNIKEWERFVGRTLAELARVTRIGSHVAFEVGEVRRGQVRLEEHVIAAADGLPFGIMGVMVNQQEFTKTANCWGVANNRAGTNSNRIVLLKRE